MPVFFEVLPERNIVLIRNVGHLGIESTLSDFSGFLSSPDCKPGQRMLSDMSEVTSYERDFTGLLKVQAKIAERFFEGVPETLVVFYAPTDVSEEVSRVIQKSWADSGAVIPRVVKTEAEALHILGQSENRIADLLAKSRSAGGH